MGGSTPGISGKIYISLLFSVKRYKMALVNRHRLQVNLIYQTCRKTAARAAIKTCTCSCGPHAATHQCSEHGRRFTTLIAAHAYVKTGSIALQNFFYILFKTSFRPRNFFQIHFENHRMGHSLIRLFYPLFSYICLQISM